MDKLNIKIRVADIDDVELILSLIQQKAEFDGYLFPLEATADKLRHTLFYDIPPQAYVLLAEVEGIAVGFAIYSYTYSSFLAERCIWLGDLFLQPHMRGKGIGQALIDALVQIAEQNNCGRIEWTVKTDNTPAIAFYQKQGARIMESIRVCRIDRVEISRLAGKELARTR
ncbi:GNAT family N-acetyltransferase [Microseira sp. BLCC-F43]|jgi:GNAT superfamily N-acetyltransferase|uniref:GNAT family N-acetyltransferase n=1 Tax=Microseira sp. BLCC-F43 TaxID=3153602 RepID=UPI0035BAEFF2